MGREVRRVPKDWEHIGGALYGGSYAAEALRWDIEAEQWERGFVSNYDGTWEPKEDRTCTFEQWNGRRPVASDYMPDWPASERTHYQMYETCSEGTPISPVMETPEELARWLADNDASAFGNMTATYEQWLATCLRGSAPSAMVTGTAMESGVAALAGLEKEKT